MLSGVAVGRETLWWWRDKVGEMLRPTCEILDSGVSAETNLETRAENSSRLCGLVRLSQKTESRRTVSFSHGTKPDIHQLKCLLPYYHLSGLNSQCREFYLSEAGEYQSMGERVQTQDLGLLNDVQHVDRKRKWNALDSSFSRVIYKFPLRSSSPRGSLKSHPSSSGSPFHLA